MIGNPTFWFIILIITAIIFIGGLTICFSPVDENAKFQDITPPVNYPWWAGVCGLFLMALGAIVTIRPTQTSKISPSDKRTSIIIAIISGLVMLTSIIALFRINNNL